MAKINVKRLETARVQKSSTTTSGTKGSCSETSYSLKAAFITLWDAFKHSKEQNEGNITNAGKNCAPDRIAVGCDLRSQSLFSVPLGE
jgi:hypothetical protein